MLWNYVFDLQQFQIPTPNWVIVSCTTFRIYCSKCVRVNYRKARKFKCKSAGIQLITNQKLYCRMYFHWSLTSLPPIIPLPKPILLFFPYSCSILVWNFLILPSPLSVFTHSLTPTLYWHTIPYSCLALLSILHLPNSPILVVFHIPLLIPTPT